MQRHVALAIIVLSALFAAAQAHAHCQIPCGIYDDELRVQLIEEHITTVEKSMKQIASLAQEETANHNQLIRWVTNKESHAQKIIATISDYFLTQRVNASQEDYTERLVKHHTVIVAAMKAKQNADGKYAMELAEAIEALAPYYPEHEH